MPTLLSWPASAVVHDIKGENWQITAGWRSRFSHCLLFNPTDAKSAFTTRYWKFDAARTRCATYRTSRTSWSIPKARSNAATIGRRLSHALLVGAILHVLYAGEQDAARRSELQ